MFCHSHHILLEIVLFWRYVSITTSSCTALSFASLRLAVVLFWRFRLAPVVLALWCTENRCTHQLCTCWSGQDLLRRAHVSRAQLMHWQKDGARQADIRNIVILKKLASNVCYCCYCCCVCRGTHICRGTVSWYLLLAEGMSRD